MGIGHFPVKFPYLQISLEWLFRELMRNKFNDTSVSTKTRQCCDNIAGVNVVECPSISRDTKVVFIPKAGKISHIRPNDFRPISLSSFLLKGLERLLDAFIRENLDPKRLSKSQHAYNKGKSTESALHELVGTIESSLKYREYTMVAFLDIEGAFNNIHSSAIIAALSRLSVNGGIIKFIKRLLTKRRISANLGTTTLTRFVNRGTPQGGVLSPLIWNLAVNEILLDLDKSGCKVVAYADDVAIAASGKFPNIIRDNLQFALNKVARWARSSGLGVNPNKTELVLFTKDHK